MVLKNNFRGILLYIISISWPNFLKMKNLNFNKKKSISVLISFFTAVPVLVGSNLPISWLPLSQSTGNNKLLVIILLSTTLLFLALLIIILRKLRKVYSDLSIQKGKIAKNNKEDQKEYIELLEKENKIKALEEQLFLAQERWKLALLGNRDGVWDWETATDEVYFSTRWKEMLGYNEDEVENDLKEWEKRLHPNDREKTFRDLNLHLENKTEFYENEHRLLCKDGTYRWILDRGKVISRDSDMKPLRVIGTHTDIHDRKEHEKELRKEKEFSQKIIETSNAIIVGLDRSHMITIFNRGAENITGYNQEEVIGKDWFKIFFTKSQEAEMKSVWDSAWGAPDHSYINTIRIKNGEARLIRWHSKGLYDDEDTKRHILISIGDDITESKKAEALLRESEENLKSLIENRQDSIWSVDTGMNYIIFNSYFASAFKNAFKTELKEGLNAIADLPPDIGKFWKEKYSAVLAGNIERFQFSDMFEGKERFHHVSMNPIYLQNEIKGVSAISTEITERVLAERELQKYRDKLEQVVSERTNELEEKNRILERINRSFVGRELKMKQLKAEINHLKEVIKEYENRE